MNTVYREIAAGWAKFIGVFCILVLFGWLIGAALALITGDATLKELLP